jgi:uncharacterized protein (TIGR02266 family)
MQPAASKRTDISPQRRLPAHSGAVSGQRPRVRAVPAELGEDFQEPDFELVSRAERAALLAPDPDELAKARRVLADRERAITALGLRNFSLQSQLAEVLETLHAREADLEELQKFLLPSAPLTEESEGTEALGSSRARSAPEASAPLESNTGGTSAPLSPQMESIRLQLSASVPAPKAIAGPQSFELEFTGATRFFAGLEQDLSQGGVFVATYRELAIGTRLELEFQLTDGSAIRARGVVCWLRSQANAGSERPGAGVAFIDLSQEALSTIVRFCQAEPPLYMEL